ncbi:MAG: RHS repeat-associated core domain-containing protein [Candidatus Micrarchaeota archaeon]
MSALFGKSQLSFAAVFILLVAGINAALELPGIDSESVFFVDAIQISNLTNLSISNITGINITDNFTVDLLPLINQSVNLTIPTFSPSPTFSIVDPLINHFPLPTPSPSTMPSPSASPSATQDIASPQNNPPVSKTYFHAGALLASVSSDRPGVTQYYIQDHLGSTAGVVEAGEVVQENQYYSFGEDRSAEKQGGNELKYTGKQQDAESGLYFYGARYYDAGIGRFLQADPVSGGLKNPESLNRYAYVENNPIKFIDPDGYEAETPDTTEVVAIVPYQTVDSANLGMFFNKISNSDAGPSDTFLYLDFLDYDTINKISPINGPKQVNWDPDYFKDLDLGVEVTAKAIEFAAGLWAGSFVFYTSKSAFNSGLLLDHRYGSRVWNAFLKRCQEFEDKCNDAEKALKTLRTVYKAIMESEEGTAEEEAGPTPTPTPQSKSNEKPAQKE